MRAIIVQRGTIQASVMVFGLRRPLWGLYSLHEGSQGHRWDLMPAWVPSMDVVLCGSSDPIMGPAEAVVGGSQSQMPPKKLVYGSRDRHVEHLTILDSQ